MAKKAALPHQTRNDMPAQTRAQVVAILNARLADAIDLQMQAKQAHWNVKGPAFYQLHELFDKVAESAREAVDDLAERAVALGGIAEGTVQAVGAATTLKPYSLTIKSGPDHVKALASAIAAAVKGVRAAIDDCEAAGDAGTADLFTEISQELDKHLWFVEAHLQANK